MYQYSYYQPTTHFFKRYRKRMGKSVKNKTAKKNLLQASNQELIKRANFMLLFSIFGREGDTPNTEVRYYFEWNIVIDTVNKTIVTMYIDEKRPVPPVKLFGDRKLRKMMYDVWFRPNSKVHKQLMEVA